MRLDAVIFGGGAAGLWLLDRLSRQGCQAVLLEADALGTGQTIGAQGIIHGGLKYTLQGWLTKSAQHIRKMPDVWRRSLLGQTAPNLTRTRLRAECCYLWRTDSLASRAGMIGARIGLQVTPESVEGADRPEVLAPVSGTVARLAEQVIQPASFLADLAGQYRERILKIDAASGVAFDLRSPGEVEVVRLNDPASQHSITLRPRQVIFTAGAGNAALRGQVGLNSAVMQRRPLQMVLCRGRLPELNGHCVDGLKTRVTITSDCDAQGRMVWQIGGQLAEDGVTLSPQQLVDHAANELRAVLPALNLADIEWSTYRVDRAEGATDDGNRPETIQVLCAGNVTTGWPTKLALAPILAEEIASRIQPAAGRVDFDPVALAAWPRPEVAPYPWEDPSRTWWQPTERPAKPHRRAA
jgi:glycerol-3-phosphate dehydrogenase